MQILQEPQKPQRIAVLNLGFRLFFLLAGSFAVIAMLLWMMLYFGHALPLPEGLSSMLWHGHEMIFGYSMAVIAGFLLTAVRNWTNIQTLNGWPLLILALLWLVARILPFSGIENALVIMAFFDTAFMLSLIIALTLPIVRVKQWVQLSIISKLGFMLLANILFYLGLLGILSAEAIYWGLYLGLYLVISLIMMMARRVIPMFIERGVDEEVKLRNWKWLDISSLVLFIPFMLLEVFSPQHLSGNLLAGVLFVLHITRMVNWHTIGIWRKPLLWVLYIGYGFIVLGFGLRALMGWLEISPWLPIHAFAVGGIGIITAGMMSRVSLGHTGRNVFKPPAILAVIFALLIIGAVSRVILPLLLPEFYTWLIAAAQIFWIAGFGLFVVVYAPMFLKPRVDGRFG